jgi:hypothetical protein
VKLDTTISIYAFGTSEGVQKEWDTRGRGRSDDYDPADVRGSMKRDILKVRGQNLDPNESVTVYHGKADVPLEKRMGGSKMFFVTDQPKAAAFHGEVHQTNVPRSALMPDTTEGMTKVNGQKVSGAESFHGWHSATLPMKYFTQLEKV